jgi:hypothetical protein
MFVAVDLPRSQAGDIAGQCDHIDSSAVPRSLPANAAMAVGWCAASSCAVTSAPVSGGEQVPVAEGSQPRNADGNGNSGKNHYGRQ